MSINKIFSLFCISILLACNTNEPQNPISKSPLTGNWRLAMNLNGDTLPFNFTLDTTNGAYQIVIMNAEERIDVDNIRFENDSLFIELPVFESIFKLAIVDSSTLIGEWVNFYKSDDYKISVTAKHGADSRFYYSKTTVANDLSGTYEVTFGEKENSLPNSIGMFEQTGNIINGTFATETGDYRYLEGVVDGDSLFLSTFDGSHAFLFKAEKKDSIIEGIFLSGTHFSETWKAKLNPEAILRNPDSLTFIKEGYDGISFDLPNAEGRLISLNDPKYKNKVVIVQIMGSWCPNCLDETKYLSSLYDSYAPEGLEIIALAFERTKTKEKALNNLKRLKAKTGAQYEFLLGGATRDEKAAEVLPMLNHIMSYPTAIFIDKKGNVRRIHTGFYGPSTGIYYDSFVNETEELVEQMLSE